MTQSPFDLDNAAAYAEWRARKLDTAPRRLEDIVVELGDPRELKPAERQRLLDLCATCNMAVYAGKTGTDPDKEIPRRLGLQMGLSRLDSHWLTDDDGISPLSVQESGARPDFIPYTDRPIKWHTDGYYNTPECAVRGLMLHCAESAERGGENQLLDHEIAYILLRDENPEYIRALSRPDVMTIPPRMEAGEDGGIARSEQPGPVFSVDEGGFLHMRYTARTVSIVWRNDAVTHAALSALSRILATPTPWTLRGRLEPGMGLVSNNVLHDRSGFADGTSRRRLLYRARYYDRVIDRAG
ncbi:MAG: TauD/TfdA family dioxygenase [Rhodocyclaceae bacterium]|nr:TauD/TfdA family dioxygenase [Rhodocyclaceae bacterium]